MAYSGYNVARDMFRFSPFGIPGDANASTSFGQPSPTSVGAGMPASATSVTGGTSATRKPAPASNKNVYWTDPKSGTQYTEEEYHAPGGPIEWAKGAMAQAGAGAPRGPAGVPGIPGAAPGLDGRAMRPRADMLDQLADMAPAGNQALGDVFQPRPAPAPARHQPGLDADKQWRKRAAGNFQPFRQQPRAAKAPGVNRPFGLPSS